MPDPFHVRFNIELPVKDARIRFINRIENRVLAITKTIYYDRTGRGSTLDSVMIDVETALGEPHLDQASSPLVFAEIWRRRVAMDLSRCLLAVEGLYRAFSGFDAVRVRELSAAVTETINQSEVDLAISWQDGVFFKKGAELLDQKLVNESLRWLAEPQYQNVLIPFKKGLSH